MKELGLVEQIELYQGSPEVRRELGKVSLYAFVGPSGSGKDSVMNTLAHLRPNRFKKVVGDTSRRRRKGEINGLTYNFRTKEAMLSDLRDGNFVQVAQGYTEDFYGTRPGQYPVEQKAMMAIQAKEMDRFRSLGFKELIWLHIVPHSDKAWREWQVGQSQSKIDEKHRLDEAVSSYSLSLLNPDTYYILNDQVEVAAQRVVQVAEGSRPSDESLAKETAVKNLNSLKSRLSDEFLGN